MRTVCFGEVMLRLCVPGNLRLLQATQIDMQVAGSEANVAVSLAQLGVASSFVTCVPPNEVGYKVLSELNKYRVDTSNTLFTGNRLGTFYLEMGTGSRSSKIIYDRAGSAMATTGKGQINWRQIFTDADWFHCTGITPAISQEAADVLMEALTVAKEMRLTISCDLNFRANLWKYGKHPSEVMPSVVEYFNVLLADGDTANTYFNITGGDYKSIAEKLLAKFLSVQLVAMTARQTPSATHNIYSGFLYDRQGMYQSKEYNITPILDRIGSGDAFMAALIYALQTKKEQLQDAVDFAAAAAALKHSVYGDFNLASAEEIEALMLGDTGGKVKR